MFRRGTGRNGGRGRGRGSRPFVTKRQLRNENRGVVLKPNPAVPSIVASPWYSLVVIGIDNVKSAGNGLNISVKSICDGFWKQLNFQDDAGTQFKPIVDFKFESVRMWCKADDVTVMFTPYDLQSPQGDPISHYSAERTITDSPAKNQWATVGFMWPEADQMKAFGNLQDFVVGNVQVSADADLIIHVHLLWKSAVIPSLSSGEFKFGGATSSLSSSVVELSIN